jgi:hypothetical protein
MKIRIRKDARAAYIGRCAHGLGFSPVNWVWAETLGKIAGKTIEVETEFLFSDQFNTVPIIGINNGKTGLRLMNSDVAEVIDDIRPTKVRCDWCGKTSDLVNEVCPHCGKHEYIHGFNNLYTGSKLNA